MYFANRLLTFLPVVALVQTVAVALEPSQIYQIAEGISVLIDGQNPGSGVTVAEENGTYYVLTAKHVVETEDEYTLITPDKKQYVLDYSRIVKFEGVDLALVVFESDRKLETAQLADSQETSPGTEVHIYGFPNPGREITNRIPQFTSGKITATSTLKDGYGLVYDNITRAGMSGGPVLNSNGQVVGIHGRAEAEETDAVSKIGLNLGIPIATFIEMASDLGIDAIANSSESDTSIPPTPPPIPAPANGVPSRPTVITSPQSDPNSPVCAGRNC